MSSPTGGTHRLRIDLAYDGAGFHGWAVQKDTELRTVQGVLEDAITRVLRLDAPAQLVVAGRTDAGVHARGQVAHLDVAAQHDPEHLERRLRRLLPPDVVVHRVRVAPEGFDARFSAIWRRYVYRLWDAGARPDPLLRFQTATVRGDIDPAAITTAARQLLGLHDFAAFCKARPDATTIRTLLDCSATRLDDGCGTVAVTVLADAFCHSMVRSLVGALAAVGTGQRDVAWLARVAASSTRHPQVVVMPACGLSLEEVGYPADADLATRAETARRFRSSDELSGSTAPHDRPETSPEQP